MSPENHANTEEERTQSDAEVTQSPVQSPSSISIPAAIITGAVIIAIALFLALHQKAPTVSHTPQPQAEPGVPTSVAADIAVIRPADHVRGNLSTAQVALIEYSDSDCPYCSRFHPVLNQLMDEYVGKLALVYRHYPLNIHPNAYTEAMALECAAQLGGNDAFWKYLDTVINVTLNPDPKSNQALVAYAKEQGLDSALFTACMANDATAKPVDAHVAEAESIGARGTPFSIVVNLKTGKQVIIPGAYPIETVRENINSLLN